MAKKKQGESRWDENEQKGYYPDKIHHGEMKATAESTLPESIKIKSEKRFPVSDDCSEAQKYAQYSRRNGFEIGYSLALKELEEKDKRISEKDKEIADYKEVLEDHKRLVRELDVIINGEAGAAKQASLIDLFGQVKELVSLKSRVLQIAENTWDEAESKGRSSILYIKGEVPYKEHAKKFDKSTYINNLKKELNIQS